MNALASDQLPADLNGVLGVLWFDNLDNGNNGGSWYETFLKETLDNEQVEVGEWRHTSVGQEKSVIMTRSVRSLHPSKLSFPGLPSHAESIKTQVQSYVWWSSMHILYLSIILLLTHDAN